MNGKGSQPRKGANNQAYYNNYDSIFRKPKELTTQEREELAEAKDSMSHSEFVKISKRNEY